MRVVKSSAIYDIIVDEEIKTDENDIIIKNEYKRTHYIFGIPYKCRTVYHKNDKCDDKKSLGYR